MTVRNPQMAGPSICEAELLNIEKILEEPSKVGLTKEQMKELKKIYTVAKANCEKLKLQGQGKLQSRLLTNYPLIGVTNVSQEWPSICEAEVGLTKEQMKELKKLYQT